MRRIQRQGTLEEKDLFGSLRGFQMHSRATVAGQRQGGQVAITFRDWMCEVKDRSDWNYSEYLTVPNPDFGSRAPGAVRPGDNILTVYDSNAKRLENAGLAAPYNIRSLPWSVTDRAVTAPASVTA